MKINMDMHIHSEFSCDSETSIRDICIAAISKDLKYICVTDHVDYNKNDYGYGYYNSEKYFKEFNKCKVEFKNDIKILSGIEISEPHIYIDEFKTLKALGYDMIIGSIHWLGEHFIGQRQLLSQNRDVIQKWYFDELLRMINESDIDVVGHLDRPKIVLKEMPLIEEYIDEILSAITNNDIAVEINTRAFRKGWGELMPANWIIKKYIDMGGQKIVVGSDAHSADEVGEGYQNIYDNFNDELYSCLGIYSNDKFIKLSEIS